MDQFVFIHELVTSALSVGDAHAVEERCQQWLSLSAALYGTGASEIASTDSSRVDHSQGSLDAPFV